MVGKFKTLLKKIEENNGEVILMAIMKMDDLIDSWSVIISADWISEVKALRTKQFQSLIKLINNTFTESESLSIARVGLFKENEYIPQLFLKYKSGQKIENEKVNGFQVHEAYILKSGRVESTEVHKDQIKLS